MRLGRRNIDRRFGRFQPGLYQSLAHDLEVPLGQCQMPIKPVDTLTLLGELGGRCLVLRFALVEALFEEIADQGERGGLRLDGGNITRSTGRSRAANPLRPRFDSRDQNIGQLRDGDAPETD